MWDALKTWEKYNSILEYTWRRYNLNTTYTDSLGSKSGGSSGFQNYPKGDRSYSFNTSTGQFSTSNYGNLSYGSTFYTGGGSTLTENRITFWTTDESGVTSYGWASYPRTAVKNTSRGSYIGAVKSTSSSTYPTNGASGSYWYDTRTSAYIRGTLIGFVEEVEGTYPVDGRHNDNYWYVLVN